PTPIYTLSLHDALPISICNRMSWKSLDDLAEFSFRLGKVVFIVQPLAGVEDLARLVRQWRQEMPGDLYISSLRRRRVRQGHGSQRNPCGFGNPSPVRIHSKLLLG